MSNLNDVGNTSDVEGNTSDKGGYASDEAIEDNETKDGEEDESKRRRIDPTKPKKIVRNPQPKLNVERLQGPKGIHTIEKYFEDFKFRGKGHEKSDLNHLMKKLEHWTHRLFPKYNFDDCLKKLEVLGAKRAVQTHLKKIRLGMVIDDDPVLRDDISDEEENAKAVEDSAPIDDFDALIAEEIEKHRTAITPQRPAGPTIASQPTEPVNVVPEITEEMKEKIERNRQLAIQKRLARIEREEAERQALQKKNEENLEPAENNSKSTEDNLKQAEKNSRPAVDNSNSAEDNPTPIDN